MAAETKVVISGDASGAIAAVQLLSKTLGGLKEIALKAFDFRLLFAGASLAGLTELITHIAETGDQLNKMSQKTGIAVEDLSKLKYAAQLSNVDVEALQKGLVNLSVGVIELSQGKISVAADQLKAFGINARNTDGTIKSSSQVLGELADQFQIMPDGIEKTNAAAAIFGKRMGAEMIPLLNGGSAGLKAMGDEAERLGIVMSGELAKKSEEFNDNLARMKKLSEATGIAIGNKLIPILNEYITQLLDAKQSGLGIGEAIFSLGLTDPAKSPAEQIKRITAEIVALKKEAAKGDALSDALTGAVAVDNSAAIASLERQRKYFELQQKRQTGDGVASAEELAAKRVLIEKQMQTKLAELAKLRGVAEGKVSADILDTDAKRTDEQIKNAERLRDALLTAWQSSVKGAADASAEAEKLLAKAADIRQTGADKAAAKTRSVRTPEEQQAQIQGEFSKAADSAGEAAALAKFAAIHGRVENAAKLAQQAEKDAERAAKFADQIDDPQAAAQAIQKAAEIQAQLVEAQAAAKKKESQDLAAQADAQKAKLAEIEKQLTDLQTKAASIRVEADITNATNALTALQAQLENIKDKTVTVSVNTVNSGATPAAPDAIPARAYGGVLPGWAPHDRADNMIYRGTPGEWVMQRRAVRYYGPDFMAALNAMRLPKYANGGLLGNLRMPSISGAATAPSSNVTFNFPGMGKFPASMAPDVLGELKTAFARESLKRGARA